MSDWITEARSCSGRSSAEWLSQDKVIQHRNESTHDNTIIHSEHSAQEIKGAGPVQGGLFQNPGHDPMVFTLATTIDNRQQSYHVIRSKHEATQI